MRPLRYGINLTLDGCCDHRVGIADEELHAYWAESLLAADALLYGRVVYGMMEEAWRPVAEGTRTDGIADWMLPFARAIDAAKKYVVSDTLPSVGWNSELVRGPDLRATVERLKAEPGRGIATGGVRLPLALAKMGLIDEYEFVIHPRIAGHGPTLLSGLPQLADLRLVDRRDFRSGAFAVRYEAKR